MKSKIGRLALLLSLLTGVFIVAPRTSFAAANIVLSTPTLAADGKTLTVSISGGSGTGYAPASNITGLVVEQTTNGNSRYAIASSAISGSTLTIVLTAFVPSDDVLTLDISAASNLTDSTLNTAQGQTDISVTNNSSKTVSRALATNAAIQYYGRTTTTGGGTLTTFTGNSEAVFVVNGTDANAIVLGTTAASITISIDGAASTTATLAAVDATSTIPLFSGLAAGDHTVVIKNNSGYSSLFIASAIQTAGGTGVYRAPSFTDGIGYGQYLKLGDAGFAATGNLDNLRATTTNGYSTPSHYEARADAFFRVRMKASALRLWMYLNGSTLKYSIDDVVQGSTVVPNIGRYGWVTIATGLDNSTEHVYGIIGSGQPRPQPNPPRGVYIDALMLTASGDAFSATPVPAITSRISAFGDSITEAERLTDTTTGWVYKIANVSGALHFNQGISSTNVITHGSAITANITDISPEVDKNFILYGTNDIVNGSTVASAQFGTSYRTMLTNLLNNTTDTTHYVMGIIPRLNRISSIPAWNGAGDGIQGSVDTVQAANPADADRLVYLDTSDWGLVSGSGTQASDYATNYFDNLHPNVAGNAIMANYLIPYAALTGYTVSGPSSGNEDTASTDFTVTAASGSTYTGNRTVTISDGGQGGTFTPSVGTASINTVTVTPTASTTAFTFTYTPVTEGVKTLTFTNGQDWTDPSALSYTVSASSSEPEVEADSRSGSGTRVGVFRSNVNRSSHESQTLEELRKRVKDLQTTIASLLNSNQSGGQLCQFYRDLKINTVGEDVRCLQKYLNKNGYSLARSGTGSLGLETRYFGTLTTEALIRFQNANSSSILAPVGLTEGSGFFGPSTRAFINSK